MICSSRGIGYTYIYIHTFGGYSSNTFWLIIITFWYFSAMWIIHLLARSFHFFPNCSGQHRNKTVAKKITSYLTYRRAKHPPILLKLPKKSCVVGEEKSGIWAQSCASDALMFLEAAPTSLIRFSISEISTGPTALGQQEQELETVPKSSKSQPKLALRGAPRLLQMLPPTNIFKYTEIFNSEPSFMICKAQRSTNSVYLGHKGWRFRQQLMWKPFYWMFNLIALEFDGRT